MIFTRKRDASTFVLNLLSRFLIPEFESLWLSSDPESILFIYKVYV